MVLIKSPHHLLPIMDCRQMLLKCCDHHLSSTRDFISRIPADDNWHSFLVRFVLRNQEHFVKTIWYNHVHFSPSLVPTKDPLCSRAGNTVCAMLLMLLLDCGHSSGGQFIWDSATGWHISVSGSCVSCAPVQFSLFRHKLMCTVIQTGSFVLAYSPAETHSCPALHPSNDLD